VNSLEIRGPQNFLRGLTFNVSHCYTASLNLQMKQKKQNNNYSNLPLSCFPRPCRCHILALLCEPFAPPQFKNHCSISTFIVGSYRVSKFKFHNFMFKTFERHLIVFCLCTLFTFSVILSKFVFQKYISGSDKL